MTLAWRRRSTAVAAFALLALVAELLGRSATMRLDRTLPVDPLATKTTSYYPFLLAGVKVIGALAVAALLWRILRARAMADAADRLLSSIGHPRVGPPRPRLRLSLRRWVASFVATSLWYLAQNDGVRVFHGGSPLLAPWLHTYALPVFAVLAILLALGWGAVRDWLAEVEGYAAASFAQARRILRPITPFRRPRPADERAPRLLFGLAFESRPPPPPG
jgi:hypothetical protein